MVAPSLLITDDDRDFRETLQNIFAPRGFTTYLARDGEEAVHIVKSNDIHLVLMDMHMPRLNGLEAIDLIKRFHEELPCILISGDLDDDIRRQATQAYDVLSKPVRFQEVTSIVVDALKTTYNWNCEH